MKNPLGDLMKQAKEMQERVESMQQEIAQLSVTGEKRIDSSRKHGNAVITERAFGQFRRVFPLPAAVRAEEASASYSDGILAIDLPKQNQGGANQVTIK